MGGGEPSSATTRPNTSSASDLEKENHTSTLKLTTFVEVLLPFCTTSTLYSLPFLSIDGRLFDFGFSTTCAGATACFCLSKNGCDLGVPSSSSTSASLTGIRSIFFGRQALPLGELAFMNKGDGGSGVGGSKLYIGDGGKSLLEKV